MLQKLANTFGLRLGAHLSQGSIVRTVYKPDLTNLKYTSDKQTKHRHCRKKNADANNSTPSGSEKSAGRKLNLWREKTL